MSPILQAHIQLLESGALPIRTHYRRDPVDARTIKPEHPLRPAAGVSDERRAYIAKHMEVPNYQLAETLDITRASVGKHKDRIRQGRLLSGRIGRGRRKV